MCYRYGFFKGQNIQWLWIGDAKLETPLHFDSPDNFFCQGSCSQVPPPPPLPSTPQLFCSCFIAVGKKKMYVIPPTEYSSMYPYPVTHPADRQSQVILHKPNRTRFPRFASSVLKTGTIAYLDPGDLLFLPSYYWHQVESDSTVSVSISFWSVEPRPDYYWYKETNARRAMEAQVGTCPTDGRIVTLCLVQVYHTLLKMSRNIAAILARPPL